MSDLSIQPIRDDAGNLTGFIAIQSDVTQSVTARLQLQELSERLSLAVNGSNVGFGIPSSTMKEMNGGHLSCMSCLGMNRLKFGLDEFIGRPDSS